MKRLSILILLALGCRSQPAKKESLHLNIYLTPRQILCSDSHGNIDTLYSENCRKYLQVKHDEYGDSLFVNVNWDIYGDAMNDIASVLQILKEEKIHTRFDHQKPPEQVVVSEPRQVRSAFPGDSSQRELLFILKPGNRIYYKISKEMSDSALVLIKPLNIEAISAVIMQAKQETLAAGKKFRMFIFGNEETKYPAFSKLLEAIKKSGENKFELINHN